MNDLERDLRDVLGEDARRVPTPTSAPEGLRRSVRRRQAVFGGLVGLAAIAIVAGVVAGATMLLPVQSDRPADVGPTTTNGTLNGITITYPQTWHLIDPDTVGLNGSPTMGESPLPRIVLALAPMEAPETFGCPGRAGGDAAPLLMTVQEEPPTLGDLTSTWPVELGPMSVDASESACYPDWEFLRARWIAAGRAFEARVGLSPDASDDERDALFAAFSSMTFEPSERRRHLGRPGAGDRRGRGLAAGRFARQGRPQHRDRRGDDGDGDRRPRRRVDGSPGDRRGRSGAAHRPNASSSASFPKGSFGWKPRPPAAPPSRRTSSTCRARSPST